MFQSIYYRGGGSAQVGIPHVDGGRDQRTAAADATTAVYSSQVIKLVPTCLNDVLMLMN